MIVIIMMFYIGHAYAEIYKWVDEQGSIHYGDKPVNKSKVMDVDISKQGHIKINNSREEKRQKLLETYADDHQRKSKEKEKLKKQKKKQERGCVLSKDKLRNYERASSLYSLDKDGNRVTVSSEEREQHTMELRNKIKKYCK